MSLYDDAVATLTAWQPDTDEQHRLRRSYLTHLDEHPDGLTRHCHPDHLTASTLVVNHDRSEVLLNLHGTYRIWIQFGGHCEPADTTLAGAALREAVEETGIPGLRLIGTGPVQLSTHEVRCGPLRPSHHLDVRYVAVAPPDAEPVASPESLEVRWFARGELPCGLEESVLALIEKALVP